MCYSLWATCWWKLFIYLHIISEKDTEISVFNLYKPIQESSLQICVRFIHCWNLLTQTYLSAARSTCPSPINFTQQAPKDIWWMCALWSSNPWLRAPKDIWWICALWSSNPWLRAPKDIWWICALWSSNPRLQVQCLVHHITVTTTSESIPRYLFCRCMWPTVGCVLRYIIGERALMTPQNNNNRQAVSYRG